ncbi:low affinity iron permease family protein [Longispora fulva]|uniref:Low affinity Fe/Cu permease n=1 Tax=Longispora fulva TaxID=619741 RepID=A0A8J7KDJ0_9ACTN|nr:low affinity iron permease family protein [Longispora fulva]MBG6134070.1 low affinity Fe/Cu permease [Longispora fulva]
MPSDVTPQVGVFDRFATKAATFASKAWFFVICVLLVLIWAPSYFLIGTLDTWQLIINTATTIITFLLVALLQNTQSRSDRAVQDKLNAIADALADLMASQAHTAPQLQHDLEELRDAVGLEDKESA